MTKTRMSAFAAALTITSCAASLAHAVAITDLLTSGPNTLSGDSAERLINVIGLPTPPIMDVGDRLMGIVGITAINGISIAGSTGELTAVYDLVAITKTALTGGSFGYTFGAVPAATFLADTGVAAPAGTAMVMFRDPAVDFTRSGTIASDTASANGGTVYWYFGFTTPTDYWQAVLNSDQLASLGAQPPPGTNVGSLEFGLGRINGGIGPGLLSENCSSAFTGTTVTVHACGTGNFISKTGPSAWDAFDPLQIVVTAAPEPGTPALVGIALAALGISVRRRNGPRALACRLVTRSS